MLKKNVWKLRAGDTIGVKWDDKDYEIMSMLLETHTEMIGKGPNGCI